MKYMLLIYTDPEAMGRRSEDERAAEYGEYIAVGNTAGVSDGAQLQPADTATTVRVRGGETLTTDGPYAETKEMLGGYYLFEADDLDAAIAIAARIPAARDAGIEVRPLVEM
jgi:hypothetical protein